MADCLFSVYAKKLVEREITLLDYEKNVGRPYRSQMLWYPIHDILTTDKVEEYAKSFVRILDIYEVFNVRIGRDSEGELGFSALVRSKAE